MRVTLNSLTTDKPMALGFQIELEFGNVGFCGGRKTGEPGEKPFRSKDKNQQQTQPTYDVESRNRTRATLHWWEASALTTVPSLHPMLPTWLVERTKEQTTE